MDAMNSLDMLLHNIERELRGPMRQSELLRMTEAAIKSAKTERDSRAFIDSRKRSVSKASEPSLQNT